METKKLIQITLILFIIHLLILFPILSTKGIIINSDFIFPVYTDNYIGYHYPLWNSIESKPNIEYFFRLPQRFPFLLLAMIGISIEILLKIKLLGAFFLLSVAFLVFIMELYPTRKKGNNILDYVAKIFISLFFSYNPTTLKFAHETGLLYSLAMLPFMLFSIIRYNRTYKHRYLFFVSIFLLLSLGHPFLLAMNCITTTIFSLIVLKTKKNIMKSIMIPFLLFLFFFQPFILTFIYSGLLSIYTLLGRKENLTKLIFKIISSNNLAKIILLERDRFLIIETVTKNFLFKWFHYTSLLILIVLSLFSIVKINNKKNQKIIIFSLTGYAISTFLSFGYKSFIGELYWTFINKTIIGWIFRSPLKFQLYQVFFVSILVYTTLNRFSEKNKKKIVNNIMITFFLAIIFLGVSLEGIINLNFKSLNPINIPSELFEINNILEYISDDYKVIWYPKYEGRETNWSRGHHIGPIDMISSKKDTYSTHNNYEYINYYIYEYPYLNKLFKKQEFYNFLASINIKYIVFHNDTNLVGYNFMQDLINHTEIIYHKNNWYLLKLTTKPSKYLSAKKVVLCTGYDYDIYNLSRSSIGVIRYDSKSLKNFCYYINQSLLNTNNNSFIDIKYIKINPTFIKVKVDTNTYFVLALAETYDKLWRAEIYQNGTKIKEIESFPLYGTINGFLIDKKGRFEIIIRYMPQKIFETSIFLFLKEISFVFIIIIIRRFHKNIRTISRINMLTCIINFLKIK